APAGGPPAARKASATSSAASRASASRTSPNRRWRRAGKPARKCGRRPNASSTPKTKTTDAVDPRALRSRSQPSHTLDRRRPYLDSPMGMGMRRRLATLTLLLLGAVAFVAAAQAEVIQSGDVRGKFFATFAPTALPRVN